MSQDDDSSNMAEVAGRTGAAIAETIMDLQVQGQAQRANANASQANMLAGVAVEVMGAKIARQNEYIAQLEQEVSQLKANLKRQSANREGLAAVRDFIVNELKDVADPRVVAAIDQPRRQRIFEQAFNEFMSGDALF